MGDVVKVTVIATGFDMQPAIADSPSARRRASAPAMHPAQVPVGVRQAAQQVLARSGSPLSRPSQPHLGDAARRSIAVPGHASGSSEPRIQVQRAFGAAAIHDEATLDIPAYIRRSRT
jgi:hypothetical protein